jgi:hypothetical protein
MVYLDYKWYMVYLDYKWYMVYLFFCEQYMLYLFLLLKATIYGVS